MAARSSWHGQRIRLRALEPDDWPEIVAAQADTESGRLGDRVGLPESAAELRRWLERAGTPDPGSDDFTFGIVDADGRLVGTINTHHCDRIQGSFSYGIAIFAAHRRRGYAADAIVTLLRHYFSELPYLRVSTGVYEFNAGSLALHRGLGMVEEGRLRQAHLSGGRHWDVILFSMLRDEFRRRHGSAHVQAGSYAATGEASVTD